MNYYILHTSSKIFSWLKKMLPTLTACHCINHIKWSKEIIKHRFHTPTPMYLIPTACNSSPKPWDPSKYTFCIKPIPFKY